EGEFEKLEKSNRTIYYANQEDDVFRTYAAYILNGKNSGAIEVIYNIDCQDEKEEICEKNKESDKERALKWIESVEFINGEEGEDNKRTSGEKERKANHDKKTRERRIIRRGV